MLALTWLVAASVKKLWDEKRAVLVPASCILFLIQRTMVSLETLLYGMTVVKNNAVSDDHDILTSKYCIYFRFWGNALKISGFSLKGCLKCFNTVSNINAHSISDNKCLRYILVIFKCKIEFTREPDNNMNRQISFLLTPMLLYVLKFSRKFKRTFTSHIDHI